MTLATSLIILTSISVILALLSMQFKTHLFPPDLYVFVLRFLHFFAWLAAVTYIFLFQGRRYDGLFIAYCIFLIVHWSLLGDCILNLWEGRHYQKHVPNIYLYTIFGRHTNIAMIISGLFVIAGAVVVIMRQNWLSYRLRVSAVFATLLIALFQLRRQYYLDYTVKYE